MSYSGQIRTEPNRSGKLWQNLEQMDTGERELGITSSLQHRAMFHP
jgi:hypothetical protein